MTCDRMWYARPCQSGGGDDLRMLGRAVGQSWPTEWDEVLIHAGELWWMSNGSTSGPDAEVGTWWFLGITDVHGHFCVALSSCCSGLADKIWWSLIFSSHYSVQDCIVSNFLWIWSTQSVLSGISCPRGFVLMPCRLPWWHRDHVVTVVRRDRHWLCCFEVIYSQSLLVLAVIWWC